METHSEIIFEELCKELKNPEGLETGIKLKDDNPEDGVKMANELLDQVGLDYILLEDPNRNMAGVQKTLKDFSFAIVLKMWLDTTDGHKIYPSEDACLGIVNRMLKSDHNEFDAALKESAARVAGASRFIDGINDEAIKAYIVASVITLAVECFKASDHCNAKTLVFGA